MLEGGEPQLYKNVGSSKTNGLNKVAKIGLGHLCLREENFSFKSFGSKEIKRSKQGRQNRLRSPMPEGGEPISTYLSLKFIVVASNLIKIRSPTCSTPRHIRKGGASERYVFNQIGLPHIYVRLNIYKVLLVAQIHTQFTHTV